MCKSSQPSWGSQAFSAKSGHCNRVSQPKITGNSNKDLNISWLRHDLVKASGTFSDLSFSEIDTEQYIVVLLVNILLQGVCDRTEEMGLISNLLYLCNY